MNVPDKDWSNNTVKDDPQYGVLVNQKFLNIVDDHGLTQLVSFSTRQASMLDLVIASHPDLVSNLTISDCISGSNDHSAVFFELHLTVKVSTKKPRTVYKFSKANLEDIHHDAEIVSMNFFKRGPENISIEDNWQFFKSGLLSILDSRVPRKKIGSWNDSPWITRDLKKLLRKQKRFYNIYNKSGRAGDKLKYGKFQKALKIKLISAQDQYIENSLDCALKEKPKKFWSYIKSKKQDQIGIPPLNGNGNVLTDSTSKAEVLSNHFQQIFTKEDLSSVPSIRCNVIPAMESVILNREGIINLLKNLDSKKANGPVKLPTTLLKTTASEIAEAVTFLFSQSYESGQLPNDWRNAHVVPVFEKGEKHDPCNYRPVSLTAVLCKIMEHIIYRNIMRHLEDNDILFANQLGFQKNNSCESQLILTVEDLAVNLDHGDQIDMIILDFSKAFDKVPHQRLISKLQFYGVQGSTLTWIKSWLTGR